MLGAALCLAAGSVAAQSGAAAGAEVGYSRADLVGPNVDLAESKEGAITGVYLHFPVTPAVSVRPELLFTLRGGRTVSAIAGTDDFLSKPVNKLELLKRVENMLKLRHVTDEVERLKRYIEGVDGDSD